MSARPAIAPPCCLGGAVHSAVRRDSGAASAGAPGTGRAPDDAPVTAAGRVLAVLGAFGPAHEWLTLSELSRRSGLTLTTTHRLVAELRRWGGLERDADGRYAIGLRLLGLGPLA